ncbi:MAG: inositol monophosphatase family protein [Candidatus Eremiobacteraeota bacterium]|nr:inositol monophosphatase family protein [Candidatus Eremiobacteraeota bacterium]
MKDFMSHLARGAGKILLKYFRRPLEFTEKKDAGFVTRADLESEAYLIGEIQRRFPRSDIIAEESGERIGNNPLRWIIDPLDGTTNYGNAIPFFAVSIALEQQGSLTCGAIYNPVTEEYFYGEKGKGVWLNDEAVTISSQTDLSKAVLATGDTYYRGEGFRKDMEVITRVYAQCRVVRLQGSVALALAYTAAGKLDGFWLEHCNSWDVAAGIVMVREAGGIVEDFTREGPGAGIPSSIVAANLLLLPGIRDLLNRP